MFMLLRLWVSEVPAEAPADVLRSDVTRRAAVGPNQVVQHKVAGLLETFFCTRLGRGSSVCVTLV